ncbi:MAG: glycosyltransferase [Helicobacteraceae bacterium]|nr:glycosyltransferase [Helicobacteraceae bacterium]
MKVIISVIGRFHAFDLAKQLQNHNVLNKLISTYPKFLTKKWGIQSENIVGELLLELFNRYRSKIPFISDEKISLFVKKLHQLNVSRYIKNNDIFIGWSGTSLFSIIEAKEKGIVTMLERGSSHYSYQSKVLDEEYKLYGLKQKINYYFWQRDLLEYELADYISIPSSFVKRSFIEYGVPEHKLLVNPYGVDLSQFKQIEKVDDIFRVIFCGNLSIQKGSHYLLQAIFELGLENFDFWHIGAISEEMKPFMEKYKSSSIIYKGSYPQAKLYKLYSQGSVFCIPSLQEGMAMVQLQAMACGLPLICSTNTGGDDLITKDGEEGFVIPIRSVEAIKEKIQYLYNNQILCKQMGQKAKQRVSSGFTWDDYGDRYMKNLEMIMENR